MKCAINGTSRRFHHDAPDYRWEAVEEAHDERSAATGHFARDVERFRRRQAVFYPLLDFPELGLEPGSELRVATFGRGNHGLNFSRILHAQPTGDKGQERPQHQYAQGQQQEKRR